MTDRERWGLRGAVRTCRLQRIWYSCTAEACGRDERGDTTTLEFRADGAVAAHSHRNHDGSEWTQLFEYDAAGRLVAERTEGAGAQVSLRIHEYDSAGRLARIIARGEDGTERVTERCEYDADGSMRKTIYREPVGQCAGSAGLCGEIQYFWGVEGTDTSYSEPRMETLVTRHNTRGQPAETTFYDNAGRALSRVALTYDERANLIEEAQIRMADWLPQAMVEHMNPAQLETIRSLTGSSGRPTRIVHQYNERGQRIRTESSMFGPVGSHVKTMAYNDRGDQSEETLESNHKEFEIDDEGRLVEHSASEKSSRSEARFSYDYDDRGNWLEKRVEGRRGPQHEFSVSTIERRTLEYFDHEGRG